MSSAGLSPRVAIMIGFLALIPVLIYGGTRSPIAGAIAALNVLLIVGGLIVATRPVGPTVGAHS